MTTEIKLLASADMFSANEILRLERQAFADNIEFGGAEWSAEQCGQEDTFLRVLNCALARVTDRLRDYDIWLLTDDSVWQADTRIVRYRKRFNSLKMRGIDFEAIPDRFESVIEQSGKIKFFGGVRLDASIFPTASLTMTPRACTYIVAKPVEQPLGMFFQRGGLDNGTTTRS